MIFKKYINKKITIHTDRGRNTSHTSQKCLPNNEKTGICGMYFCRPCIYKLSPFNFFNLIFRWSEPFCKVKIWFNAFGEDNFRANYIRCYWLPPCVIYFIIVGIKITMFFLATHFSFSLLFGASYCERSVELQEDWANWFLFHFSVSER